MRGQAMLKPEKKNRVHRLKRDEAQHRDALYEAVCENTELILRAYALHEDKKPVLLYDLQERRLYVYPYEPFKADLTPRSQISLTDQYEKALDNNQIVVFVRDNVGRKLVSYSVPRG
jgi:hypothetical protein